MNKLLKYLSIGITTLALAYGTLNYYRTYNFNKVFKKLNLDKNIEYVIEKESLLEKIKDEIKHPLTPHIKLIVDGRKVGYDGSIDVLIYNPIKLTKKYENIMCFNIFNRFDEGSNPYIDINLLRLRINANEVKRENSIGLHNKERNENITKLIYKILKERSDNTKNRFEEEYIKSKIYNCIAHEVGHIKCNKKKGRNCRYELRGLLNEIIYNNDLVNIYDVLRLDELVRYIVNNGLSEKNLFENTKNILDDLKKICKKREEEIDQASDLIKLVGKYFNNNRGAKKEIIGSKLVKNFDKSLIYFFEGADVVYRTNPNKKEKEVIIGEIVNKPTLKHKIENNKLKTIFYKPIQNEDKIDGFFEDGRIYINFLKIGKDINKVLRLGDDLTRNKFINYEILPFEEKAAVNFHREVTDEKKDLKNELGELYSGIEAYFIEHKNSNDITKAYLIQIANASNKLEINYIFWKNYSKLKELGIIDKFEKNKLTEKKLLNVPLEEIKDVAKKMYIELKNK